MVIFVPMSNIDAILPLIEPQTVLLKLAQWLRLARQRERLTQEELARKSGVPAATISRFERTGLGGVETFLRLLFALGLMDSVDDFLSTRLRIVKFPTSLAEDVVMRPVKRVRHRPSEVS